MQVGQPLRANSTLLSARQLLKSTTSRCPLCHAPCPAKVWRMESADGVLASVHLSRTCAEHGEATVCIASDARYYWLAKGNPPNAQGGCCGGSACCTSDSSDAGTLGRNAVGHGAAPSGATDGSTCPVPSVERGRACRNATSATCKKVRCALAPPSREFPVDPPRKFFQAARPLHTQNQNQKRIIYG